ncbi:hypothetical protein [Roseibacillus ishigakijimensis]|uniref:Uncharacterized protein n=1 Tax=Roseibacillus ishigakijimensis TaxID=454146 RepID=A0A934RMQ8_9BACT|nr:hypothetical protein [Roseibacillus ishigakijimensis]MBK1832497.1 hypothetical protein [Roseibacillus ishigakijimensis]
MARRSKSNEEGVNLDSLMDALTNVVAVLILVLILVQTEVTNKVQEFFDNLQPATPEEVQASREELAKLQEEKKTREEKLEEEAPSPEQLEEEKRKLALLEKDAQLDESLLAKLDELKKLEEAARAKRDAEQAETSTLQEDIARLEAQLDETPVLAAEPPTEVTIPDSREIPNNAKVYYALVMKERVHFIDPFTPMETFYEVVEENRKDWIRERVRQRGADRYIYDHEKVREAFQGFDFPNGRNQTVEIAHTPTQTRLFLDIIPDAEEGGTPQELLSQPNNPFANILKILARDKDNVLLFRVNPDSFNTYLLARKLADAADVPAGWEIHTWDRYRQRLDEIEVNRLEEPPPRKPDNKPKPPRIGPKLD